MSYERVYSNRINWQDSPSTTTPLGQTNLNKMDYALYKHDEALNVLDTTKANNSDIVDLQNTKADASTVTQLSYDINQLHTTKANQTDLLQSLKSVTYYESTGIFVFRYWNNTVVTVDLNVEKIPVSFTMDSSGVITMINTDGTTYTADIGSILVDYSFVDSANIRFTETTDSNGDKTVTANIIDGSITDSKLQPQYLANITAQANLANEKSILAQSYAVGGTGTRTGEDIDNAKYYKDQARAIVGAHGHTIIDAQGNVYPNRMSLLFENGQIVDDATNDATRLLMGTTITDIEWAEINNILV